MSTSTSTDHPVNPLREGLSARPVPEPCNVVIFGASGDLTFRKLIPALYNLGADGDLPTAFNVVGFARREKTDEGFRKELEEQARKFSRQGINDELWASFASRIFYHPSEFGNLDGYKSLATKLDQLDASSGTKGNRLFYLSVAPSEFPGILQKLAEVGLNKAKEGSWARVIVEKPFGKDLPSAQALNRVVNDVFHEKHTYRIDHYLGKETAQNIMVLRFTNAILEPLWNSRYIDHVQISGAEPLGVEGRGPYYETSGALRDMIQNHLLQLLSLVAMEPPVELNADAIRDEKVKVFKSLRPMSPADVARDVVRGQYVAGAIQAEEKRQFENIELIASENFVSRAVMEAQGSCLTNKYAEGYPGRRWYGGCEHVDVIEQLAIDRVKQLFPGAEHANVQPHSGSQANTAVYFAVLQPGDRILTMDLSHGGHLTHGHKANFSGRFYEVIHYGVSQADERIDYDALAKLALETKPKMITAGASAYPRIIDFERMRAIADSVGAYLFVDMAHIAGLVAGGQHPNPCPLADFVTSTTHKSLRGPRSGLILCKEKYAKAIDAQVFPGIQGGPLEHVIAAKAVCFHEALQPAFKQYAAQIVSNAKALAGALKNKGYRLVSGGTDNHLMMIDLRPRGLNGKLACEILDHAGITVNKNSIPFDTEKITLGGGIRIGTPAVTTRGMKEEEMFQVADFIHRALESREDTAELAKIREEVRTFTSRYPLPG